MRKDLALKCLLKASVGFSMNIDSSEYIGPAEFILDDVSYSVGLRIERGEIRATWQCPQCALVVVNDRARSTADNALALARYDFRKHHQEHHCAN